MANKDFDRKVKALEKPIKLGPLALYKAKLAEKSNTKATKSTISENKNTMTIASKSVSKEAKSTEAIPTVDMPKSKRKTMKQISINYDKKVKAWNEKLASGKVKMNPPMSITLPAIADTNTSGTGFNATASSPKAPKIFKVPREIPVNVSHIRRSLNILKILS